MYFIILRIPVVRRGSSSYVQCRNCGISLRCKRCDIAMTYHRQADRLICHYCGTRRIVPVKCPKCLNYRIGYYGIGTESVVDGILNRFPGTTILRLDRDTTKRSKTHEELLSQFREGKAQVLVGTQMLGVLIFSWSNTTQMESYNKPSKYKPHLLL